MAKIKVKELGRRSVLSLPLKPKPRDDEIPHWKCWEFTRTTGIPWWKS